MISASAPAEVARIDQAAALEHVLEAGRQVDGRIGRGEEAEKGQADLGDGQEAAGLRDQPFDPLRRPVPFLGELLDPSPTDRDQGDLGGHEDAFEHRQDDDDDELEDRFHLAGRVLARP